MNKPSVSVIIPTKNGGELFESCLEAIIRQKYCGRMELIVVDSGSTDGTIDKARAVGASVYVIDPADFNHSRTRNNAVEHAHNDIIVFTVQDAVASNTNWLDNLVAALGDEYAAAFGRQTPHDDADIFAQFEINFQNEDIGSSPRTFCIPEGQMFDQIPYDDALALIKLDNVCSVYRRTLLKKYPFPDIVYAEDIAWAHRIIMQGYKIRYDPTIEVFHSHNRPPSYRLHRAFAHTVAMHQITGRVPFDLSCIDAEGIKRYDERMERLLLDIKSNLVATPQNGFCFSGMKKPVRKLISGAMAKRFIKKNIHRIPGGISKKLIYYLLLKVAANRIMTCVDICRSSNPKITMDELSSVVDQMAALSTGTFIGMVYASYLQKEDVSDKIQDYAEKLLGRA